MIKKLFLLIIFTCTVNAVAQDQQKQNSNVELPDFVITGKDVVSVQKAKKIPPGFISIISEQFVKPVFPPANLPVKEVQTPIKGSLDLIDSLHFVRGKLAAEMGSYSLPAASLIFTNPFSNGLFEAFADAANRRAYVAGSDQYHLSGGANLMLFVNNQAGFLPGTQIKFHGNFGTYGYKLFGSDNPQFKRNFNKGDAYISINNTLNRYFIFNAEANDRLASYQNENFSENLFNIFGSAKLSLPNFNLGVNANYQKQFITNDFYNNGRFYYLYARPYIGLELSKFMKVSFGFNYAKIDTDFSFSPYVGFGFYLNKAISIFGEYSTEPEFWSAGHYAGLNPYFRAQKFTNIFVKKNSAFNVTLKYEYYTYFEIDGGVKYSSSDNFPYFSDAAQKGLFDINTTGAKNITGFVNLLFHLGPYGMFYGTAQASDVRDASKNFIPYYPRAKVTLNYGYNFSFGLNAEANLQYYSGIYTDILNTKLLNPFFNLGFKLLYQWKPNLGLTLKFANLLNRKNFIWNGYQDTPLDISAGISLTF